MQRKFNDRNNFEKEQYEALTLPDFKSLFKASLITTVF